MTVGNRSARTASKPWFEWWLSATEKSNYTLVRIVPDASSISSSESGVFLASDETHPRKTIHFCMNGPVTDHEQGSFNLRNGAFIGKVAILCDPKEMPRPAGVTAADTWYRVDRNHPEGSEGLSIGKNAVVVMPEGMAAPSGVNVTYYRGGIKE